MSKIILYFFLFLLLTPFAYGQQFRTVTIDADKARPLNLSAIAEKITPVALETATSIVNGNIFLTNEYLFIASHTSIVQYDLTGKYIRAIDCGGYISFNVTCDTINKELYVPVGNTIKCYDYSGKLKREYQLKSNTLYALYNKGHLWVQTYSKKTDNEFIHSVCRINLSTGEIIPLSFSFEYTASGIGSLTYYNDNVVISLSYDTFLYQIQQDNVTPIVNWSINPLAQSERDRTTLRTNGFNGDYLFINYRRGDHFYTYLENIKTGEKHNTSMIIDDVFNTNNNCTIHPLNQTGYFFFAKDQYDINGNSVGNMPLKKGPVIFIVKAK